ncbi:hypothetical protein [Pseudorhodoferax soli]|uniref:Uncharacterized protein n=1 Tax=Pseudorhodoferax soli TaxID=545864 RepID=A0A368Y4S7_9BURK|nr:hypothetical protein [Pseudorhodoferax soli]RCW73837.1 hypothetical protein DES41_102151 [Pseudorhodoferax soli]
MYVTLEVPGFHCVEGFFRIAAAVDEPGVMNVQIFGTEDCIHTLSTLLMHGPVDAELFGKPIRMRHFNILNQADRRRIAMTVHYEERDRQY